MNQDRINELDKKLREAQGVSDVKQEVKPEPVSKPVVSSWESNEEEDRYGNTEGGDEVDQAGRVERNFIAASLKAQQEAMKPETHPDFDGESCIGCGEPIPLARLNMGKIRCVLCQTELEKLRKTRGY